MTGLVFNKSTVLCLPAVRLLVVVALSWFIEPWTEYTWMDWLFKTDLLNTGPLILLYIGNFSYID